MRGQEQYWEAVKGRIVDESQKPMAGVKVHVYDKDMVVDDYLGEATTGDDGKFRVEFTQADYTPPFSPGEGRPDIYLRLTHPDGRTHRTQVHQDLEGEFEKTDDPEKGGLDGEMEVMDLGDVEFPAGE